ncbi:hypothetical protein LG326_12615 [Metaplanococcus flavidus]
MDNLLELKIVYNMVSEGDYETALVHLKSFGMENEVSSDDNYNYLCTLIYTKLGHISLARKHLSYIQLKSYERQITMLEKELKEIEPLYILLTAKFNKAIDYVKDKDYINAHELLKEIFSKVNIFPFPIQWYKTFYILKLKVQADDLEPWINQLPAYVRKSYEINKTLTLSNIAISKVEASMTEKKKRFSSWIPYGVGVAAVLFTVLMSLNFISVSDGKNSIEEVEPQPNTAEINNETIQEETVKVPEETLDIETHVNEALYPELTDITAKAFYTEGYQQYQIDNFEEAILNLKIVKERGEKSYYTDDAHYFLIISLTEAGRYMESIEESQLFIDENDINYQLSPYLEAVHLNNAIALLESGKTTEANAMLETMIKNKEEGWVFDQAQSLLREINNGN